MTGISSSRCASPTLPPIRPQRAEPFGQLPKSCFRSASCSATEAGGEEVIRPGERAEERGERRGVVLVAAAAKHAQHRRAKSCSPARESRSAARRSRIRSRPRRRSTRSRSRSANKDAATARDGTSGCRSRARRRRSTPVPRDSSPAPHPADDEHGDLAGRARRARPESAARPHPGSWEKSPSPVAVGLHVRPLVIKVERQARDRLRHGCGGKVAGRMGTAAGKACRAILPPVARFR